MSLGTPESERDEDRALAAEHQAIYAERVAALEAAQSAPTHPVVAADHRARCAEQALIEAQREESEGEDAMDALWERRFAADPFPEVTYRPEIGTRGRRVFLP